MPVILYIRRHLVILGAVATSIVGTFAVAAHLPSPLTAAIVAVLTAALGVAGVAGLISGDKLVPVVMGLVKAVIYLVVLVQPHGFLSDPQFQIGLINSVELVLGLLIAQTVTSNVAVTVPPTV